MNNQKYVNRIIINIILTNIPAILCLPWFWRGGLSWILGSIASLINFIWLSKNVAKSLNLDPTKTKLAAVKGSFYRLSFLIIYSVVFVFLVKLNIFVFGLGLLSAQIMIYIYEFYRNLKKSKYI